MSKSIIDQCDELLTRKSRARAPSRRHTKAGSKAKYTLKNCASMAKSHPDTFHIPSLQERKSLAVGSFAKLIFVTSDGDGERMWVQVTKSGATYRGALDNDPVVISGLRRGAAVTFGPQHVCAIMR